MMEDKPHRKTVNGIVLSEPMPWVKRALCANNAVGTDTFFTDERRQAIQPLGVRVAKAICHACPVREECLDYAVRNLEIGIWGGMTTDERRMYRIRLRSKEAPAF